MNMTAVQKHKPLLGRRFEFDPNNQLCPLSDLAKSYKNQLKSKIDSGEYKFEQCSCYCSSNDYDVLSYMDRYANYYPLVICRQCGLIRANERMTEETYAQFYNDEYIYLYGDKDDPYEEVLEIRKAQSEDLCKRVMEHVPLEKGSVVFEIGCGMGTLLLPFEQRGCEVIGVDYGTEWIENGRRAMQLNLQVGSVSKLAEYGKKCDLLILNHTFEHFLDLKRGLEGFRGLIKEDGFLFVFVPGTFWWFEHICQGNVMGALQNAHTWQFSLETLKYVMADNGFQLVHGTEEIFAIFQKIDQGKKENVSLPKDEYERVVRYLKRLERGFLPKYYLKKFLEIIGLKPALKSLLQKFKNKK